jgi:hypothetical protein
MVCESGKEPKLYVTAIRVIECYNKKDCNSCKDLLELEVMEDDNESISDNHNNKDIASSTSSSSTGETTVPSPALSTTIPNSSVSAVANQAMVAKVCPLSFVLLW